MLVDLVYHLCKILVGELYGLFNAVEVDQWRVVVHGLAGLRRVASLVCWWSDARRLRSGVAMACIRCACGKSGAGDACGGGGVMAGVLFPVLAPRGGGAAMSEN
eukprot:4108817-Amphidinium_carterae.2